MPRRNEISATNNVIPKIFSLKAKLNLVNPRRLLLEESDTGDLASVSGANRRLVKDLELIWYKAEIQNLERLDLSKSHRAARLADHSLRGLVAGDGVDLSAHIVDGPITFGGSEEFGVFFL